MPVCLGSESRSYPDVIVYSGSLSIWEAVGEGSRVLGLQASPG